MHYNLLILAMSCNDPFFEESRNVTHDTWAKDIIDGMYDGLGFYSYTASKNGTEYIENNTIYLNCSDEIESTYHKTIRCFEFLRENDITFDYVLRTNTSVYFNIPLTIQMANNKLSHGDFDFYTHRRGTHKFIVDEYECNIDEFHGSFYIASHDFIYTLVDNYDIYNERNERVIQIFSILGFGIVGYDDITMNVIRFLLEFDGIGKFKMIFDTNNMPRYKCVIKSRVALKNEFGISSHEQFSEESLYTIRMLNTDEPDVINFIPFIQYRTLTSLSNRKSTKYRYIELEHAYELHEACRYTHKNT